MRKEMGSNYRMGYFYALLLASAQTNLERIFRVRRHFAHWATFWEVIHIFKLRALLNPISDELFWFSHVLVFSSCPEWHFWSLSIGTCTQGGLHVSQATVRCQLNVLWQRIHDIGTTYWLTKKLRRSETNCNLCCTITDFDYVRYLAI